MEERKGGWVGVVTVTYNSAAVLTEFLRCMTEQIYREFLLFAVDNASTDDTLRILGECGDDRLRIIANADNRGFAEGSNQGIRAALDAGCGSVLLLNNDTVFDNALIGQLNEGLNRNRVEMTCPKMLYFDEPRRIWAAGGKFQPWLGYRSVHLGENELDRGQYDLERLATFVPGCCVLIQRSVFEKVGMLDERYFVYVEDSDFMYRAMKASVKLMYIPEAKLLHKVSSLTGGEDSQFAIRYGTRNRMFFLLKHFGLIRTLPWLALCHLLWALRSLGKRHKVSWFAMKREACRESLEMWRASEQNLFGRSRYWN